MNIDRCNKISWYFPLLAGLAIVCALSCRAWCSDRVYTRVISLSPLVTRIIYLVGGQDCLIGDTTYCNVPDAARHKEKIGSVIRANVEKIVRMQPDLVISSPLSREKQLRTLEHQNIHIMRVKNPATFDELCAITIEIAEKLGKRETACEIVEKCAEQVHQIFEKTKGLEKPGVFVQIGVKPLQAASKAMFINEYIRYSGGVNIAPDESSGIYSREKVIMQNPRVILIATMGSSRKAGSMEKRRWMHFPSIDAVRNGRVYVLEPAMMCSPDPVAFVKGLKIILPMIHPEVSMK